MINNASKLKHWYSLSEYPSGKFSMHFHAHIEIYVLVCRFSFLILTMLYALFCNLLGFLNNVMEIFL